MTTSLKTLRTWKQNELSIIKQIADAHRRGKCGPNGEYIPPGPLVLKIDEIIRSFPLYTYSFDMGQIGPTALSYSEAQQNIAASLESIRENLPHLVQAHIFKVGRRAGPDNGLGAVLAGDKYMDLIPVFLAALNDLIDLATKLRLAHNNFLRRI